LALVQINPRALPGPWAAGYALDRHTLSRTYKGPTAYGRPTFDTKRPPVGQLLCKLKFHADQTAIEPLADTAANFLKNAWHLEIDAIVPVPPSNVRTIQPVKVVAKALASRIGVPVCRGCLLKIKQTPQLKDLTDYDEREAALKDAFKVGVEFTQGKNLLLFDDIFGSGATADHITELLLNSGQAKKVYLLTLTRKAKS
jgi:predicted amidophosphoribosyltransferase